LPAPFFYRKKKKFHLPFQVHKGMKGKVTAFDSGEALKTAAIVVGKSEPEVQVFTNKFGQYYRLVSPGTHSITVKCKGYQSQHSNITISPDKPYASSNVRDFALRKV